MHHSPEIPQVGIDGRDQPGREKLRYHPKSRTVISRCGERLVRGQRLANVPAAQTRPTRLTPKKVLARVGNVYGVGLKDVVARSHPGAYQCAVWVLRRAANEPLRGVAQRFGVSQSRVSHIQQAMETGPLTRQHRRAMRECKVKQ